MASNASGKKRRMRVGLGAGMLFAMSCILAPSVFAGVEQDTEQAEKEFARGNLVGSIALWRKAAEEGYAPAQARLGDILDKAEEDEEAVSWYRKAAAQGNAAGEYGLGQMYAKGEGVKKDQAQARSYTLRAAEKGHLPAMLQAIEICKDGAMGGTVDLAQASAWEAKVKASIGTDKKK
jgi:uncharacterized protein